MCLSLATKNLHFILIETFVRAELQLCGTIAEVNIAYSVANTLAEVARLGTLERRSSPCQEAVLRAEDGPRRADDFSRERADILMTPRAAITL